jgi:hypothetical protein
MNFVCAGVDFMYDGLVPFFFSFQPGLKFQKIVSSSALAIAFYVYSGQLSE